MIFQENWYVRNLMHILENTMFKNFYHFGVN